jgi:hypothetical protein
MKAALITLASFGALLWISARNAHMRGVPAFLNAALLPPTPAMTHVGGVWFGDDIGTTQAAYRQRLAEACGDLDPKSLDYDHCEEEFSRSESDSQGRDDRPDEDDYEWVESQQAHQDALEQMAR